MPLIQLDRIDFHTHVQIGAHQRKSAIAKGGEAPCDIVFDSDTGMAKVHHIATKRECLVPQSNIAAMYPSPVTKAVVPAPPPLKKADEKK